MIGIVLRIQGMRDGAKGESNEIMVPRMRGMRGMFLRREGTRGW